MKLPPNIRGLGIPWFTAETWARLREITADPGKLYDTFDEWHASAEAWFESNVSEGDRVERVLIDPDELLEWCQANDVPVDAHARAGFAAFVLARRARAH